MPRPFKRNIENSEIDAAFSPIAVAFINAANVIMPRIFIVPGTIELRSPYKIVVPLIIVSKIVALLIVTSRNRYLITLLIVIASTIVASLAIAAKIVASLPIDSSK